ncbi:MAG: U32 family peptidase [Dialister sp.]|nr:U32 family peptidase [Dialister sp.]
MKKIELLAPAGNMEKMKMALRYGADAVYLAGKGFGLRAYGGNFSNDELKEAVDFAHAMNRRVYVTVNIIPRNEDLEGLDVYLKYLESIGADAVLISDLGVFSLCREAAPRLPIHVSTQASSANWRTVDAWKKLGASRVVLAREVSLAEMADIRRRVDMELEIFGHGAMCISWSGRCLLSNFFTNGKRQSNRGECIQACRFKYTVQEESRPGQYWPVEEDEHGTYIFNSKDLCLVNHIKDIIEGGAASLKIEGRMKSVYYVAAVVAAYRKAIDAYYEEKENYQVRPEWRAELEKVSHRPYTTGFAYEQPDHTAQEYESSQPGQSYDFIGLILPGNGKRLLVEQRNHFKTGERAEYLTPAGEIGHITIGTLYNEVGKATEKAPHPLEKLEMDSDMMLPAWTILRRPAR